MPILPRNGLASRKIELSLQAASKRPSVEQLMQHAWLRDHMQEQLLRDQAALASTLQAKKVSSGPTSVSITIDCTAGAGGGGSSGNSGSSSNAVSSTGSADSADTKEVLVQLCSLMDKKCYFTSRLSPELLLVSKIAGHLKPRGRMYGSCRMHLPSGHTGGAQKVE